MHVLHHSNDAVSCRTLAAMQRGCTHTHTHTHLRPDDEVDAGVSVSTLHLSSQVSTTPFQSLGTGMGLSTSSTNSGSSFLDGTMSVAPLVFDLEEELFNLGTPKRACAYTPPCTPESSKKAKTAGQDY